MTEEEFKQAKELHNRIEELSSAQTTVERIQAFTMTNISDLSTTMKYLTALPKESEQRIFDFIDKEIKNNKIYLEEELQKYLEL